MSSPTCPVHGTKLTYPIVPRVSMYGCADCFRDTPFSSWQFTDAPAPLAFDAALAALDVEPTHHPDRMVTTYDILGLDAVRAAHRAEVERAVAEEREACAFASIDVIRAVMRELDEFSKGEVAENGYIDEGDDDGTGHTPFRNGWTLYGFARNEMCGVLTKVPAAVRARGVKS